jgi:hypothetical protein
MSASLTIKLEAFHRLSDEYRNARTALRIMRDLIIKGKLE